MEDFKNLEEIQMTSEEIFKGQVALLKAYHFLKK